MSKSSELDKRVKTYILAGVTDDDGNPYPGDTQGKIDFIRSRFESEKSFEIKRDGRLKALTSWFQGLGFPGHIAFYNFDILNLAKEWGSLPENPTEAQENKILGNYWNFMANKTLQIFNGYRIPK